MGGGGWRHVAANHKGTLCKAKNVLKDRQPGRMHASDRVDIVYTYNIKSCLSSARTRNRTLRVEFDDDYRMSQSRLGQCGFVKSVLFCSGLVWSGLQADSL